MDTPLIYKHFLWPSYCPNQCGLTVFLGPSFQFPLGVALDTSIQIRSGPCRRGLVFLKQNILHTFQRYPTSIFGKYVCCKISCLPASWEFQTSKNGIIAHFYGIFALKRSPRIFGKLFSGWNFWKVFIPIIFESLDFQLGNPNRWKIFRG